MTSRNSQSEDSKGAQFSFLEQKIKARFEVLNKIGSGAYGHVWKVRCKKTGELLAIKKVFLAFQNQTDAQKVYREISLLSKIQHENVVRLKEVITSDGTKDIYLLLEYLESDVFKAIKNRVLDKMHKKYIVYQLASALNYLHSGGVLHRDLKPSNILINSACEIKICDFGLSRTLTSQFFNKPLMTEFIATRWYRAPEVLLGSRCYSTKSDMWSLGCLIYQLYSRRTLLPGDNTIDQITKLLQFKGKPTKQQIQSLNASKARQVMTYFDVQKKPLGYYYDDLQDQEVKNILEKLLVYNPAERWSAKELMECEFLSEFRDISTERIAERPYHLDLNDNRKYKLQRYRAEILKLGSRSNEDKIRLSVNNTKRFLFTYRPNNFFSLHASTSNLKPKMNTTMRGKFSKQKKHQSESVSVPKNKSTHKQTISSLYCSPKHSVLKIRQKNGAHTRNSNQSSFYTKKSRKYLNSKHKQDVLRGSQSPSMSRIGVKMREESKKDEVASKQNYENRLRLLKKQKIKYYRHQNQNK